MANKSRSLTTISDPSLDPYFITKDDHCYTVIERIIPNGDHFRTKNGGKEYAKPQGYYPNFDQALHKVAELKLDTKDYSNLKNYIQDYQSISNQIKSYTDGIRSTV